MPADVTSAIRCWSSCAGLLALLAPSPVLAEFGVQVSLTSEYINRGVSWSNGNPALQVGLDYSDDSGFFGGAWASTTDLSNPSGRRNVEVDYYLGHSFAEETAFPTSISVIHYTYPDNSSTVDYDYTEALFTTSWKNFSLEFGYTNNLYGFDISSQRAELRGDWSMRSGWVFGAGLGTHNPDHSAWSDYLYWDAGISARYSRLTIDIRWHDSEPQGGFARRWDAGAQAVATLSVAY